MNKFRWIITIIAAMMISCTLLAQNNTNSPFSRYGYGKLADQAFGSQRGMGGIGVGLRNSKLINPINPASYSNVDSMTFMFDFGLTGQIGQLEDGGFKSNTLNGNLEYLALQFPLSQNLGMGIGFEPVSFVGYKYGYVDSISSITDKSTNLYTGTGGFSKIYTDVSYNFFNRLSVGINLGYLFGDIIYQREAIYTNAYNNSWPDSIQARGILYQGGVQYYHPLGKNKSIVIGAIYSPKIKYNVTVSTDNIRYDASTGALQDHDPKVFRDKIFEMPETFGLGMTYNLKNKLTLGADIQYQKWAEANYFSKTDTLANRLKINIGGEFIPNIQSRKFLERMSYRMGAYYSNSYIKVNGFGYNEYGASLGFGIPLSDRRSYFHLAFDYTALLPQSSLLMSERYFKLTLSYTFNELWFFKRKIQ
jgi:hypothetical protein